jgi:signal transduction histidine kinase
MSPRRETALLALILLLLVAGLGVLAALQYRWIDRISEAERVQMRANLDFAARRFIDGFEGELDRAFTDPGDHRIVGAVYVIDMESLTLQRLENGRRTDVEWPAEFAPLRERLLFHEGPMPGPFLPEIPALLVTPRRREPGPDREDERRGPPGPPPRVRLLKLNLKDVFADLTKRHFPSGTIITVMRGEEALYRSGEATGRPDLEVPFAPLMMRGGGPDRGPRPFNRGNERERRPEMRLLLHRGHGGVNAAIAAARTRNLALAFGVLLILLAAFALLVALLRRAHRLRAQQTEFVAAMSHELNTPVAALRSAGENLRDGIVTDRDRVTRYGESIVREASRLGDMLGQVLEYAGLQARRGEVRREPVDVASIIDEAIAQCRWLVDGTPLEIAREVENDLPQISGDAQALTSAVQNLLANAIRYGRRDVKVSGKRNGSGVAITVEDRGPGIDGREAGRVFEPFYRGRNQSNTRGAGLGLSIVQRIVAAHGGTIELDRKRREGAAFTIRL